MAKELTTGKMVNYRTRPDRDQRRGKVVGFRETGKGRFVEIEDKETKRVVCTRECWIG